MNIQEYLLGVLAEEACEIAHRALKASRFGLQDIHDGTTSEQKLQEEVADLLGVLHMLHERSIIPADPLIEVRMAAKIQKVERYMKYSQEKGTLT